MCIYMFNATLAEWWKDIFQGVTQGDPLSPYLFVLCVERHGHIIELAMWVGLWKPIKLYREGPQLSHWFFVEDLILMGEASSKHMEIIQKCLDVFYWSSGQLVNKDKTCTFLCQNVNHNLAQELSPLSSFSLRGNLRRCLGFTFQHNWMGRGTY